jgi:hypothetical protein
MIRYRHVAQRNMANSRKYKLKNHNRINPKCQLNEKAFTKKQFFNKIDFHESNIHKCHLNEIAFSSKQFLTRSISTKGQFRNASKRNTLSNKHFFSKINFHERQFRENQL